VSVRPKVWISLPRITTAGLKDESVVAFKGRPEWLMDKTEGVAWVPA